LSNDISSLGSMLLVERPDAVRGEGATRNTISSR
jgi:hypothetical protein